MALGTGSDAEQIGSGASGGVIIGRSPSDSVNPGKVGFYGLAPSAQRPYSSAVHATSALASSADFGATQLAAVHEIQKTLIALGIWATA